MEISRRVKNHVGSSKRKAKTPFHLWLKENTKNFKVIILDKVPFSESSKSEMRWIKRINYKFPLYNVKSYSTGNPGVGRVVWTDYLLSLLGKTSDTKISKIMGCSRGCVTYKREQLGIPVYNQDRGQSQRVILDLTFISRLGSEPDYIIANDAGVSKFVVARYRKKMNIPSYAEKTGNNGKIKKGEPHRRWK